MARPARRQVPSSADSSANGGTGRPGFNPLCLSVVKTESPGPRQTPRVLLPPTTVSSPAYSMSVIIIVLSTLAAAVLFTIAVLACRRQRKQWRNRKR